MATALTPPQRLAKLLRTPPWRTVIPALTLVVLAAAAYGLWTPGATIRDGRHDRGTNGIWLQHGWLGDDGWFQRNDRNPTLFRSDEPVRRLDATLRAHGIRDLYPHLCPAEPDGRIPPVDHAQTERFLRICRGYRVLPWIGGVLASDCLPESPEWRRNFVHSSVELLRRHPTLAGVHVNIEPMPSGNPDFPVLLRELRAALPPGKILSVAAYPPPTRWHPYPDVHWDEAYFRQVAAEVDQLAVMMYDTSIRWPKLYQQVLRTWTPQVLEWGAPAEVLLGVPDYDDAGTGYHHPDVENLPNALRGIHGGLQGYGPLPGNYAGIALYSEWQTDTDEWGVLETEFTTKARRH
jgi:hypothetical protein